MKKRLLTSSAVLILLCTGAWAVDGIEKLAPDSPAPTSTPAPSTTGKHHEWTLEDARKHAHAYADKLDKMTPEEWEKKEQKRKAWKEKWKAMSPEEKEAYKKERYAKHHHTGNGDTAVTSSPATAPATGGK